MLKASAQSPELVQILLVAFSRRICCSRVESVSTKPRLPLASTVSPHRRPGIWRTYLVLHAKRPTYGPPNWRPTPSDCPSPTTMSAPISPGDLMRPSATGSRSEEHTSELQSLMRIQYAVFCLKQKKT